MFEFKFAKVVSIALALQCILQYKLINTLNVKCYFRANLKTNVSKIRISWVTSQVKFKSVV